MSVPAIAGAPAREGRWRFNTGKLPPEAIGKRVRVRLAHGSIGSCDEGPMSPPGWAADGKSGCRWTLTGSPFDIIEYEVIA